MRLFPHLIATCFLSFDPNLTCFLFDSTMLICRQVSVCLFLGASFTALEDSPVFTHKEEEPGPADFSRLRRESFLGMIETRIGLPRFNDLLRKPLNTDRGGCRGLSPNFFFTLGFKVISFANSTSIRIILAGTESVHQCTEYHVYSRIHFFTLSSPFLLFSFIRNFTGER